MPRLPSYSCLPHHLSYESVINNMFVITIKYQSPDQEMDGSPSSPFSGQPFFLSASPGACRQRHMRRSSSPTCSRSPAWHVRTHLSTSRCLPKIHDLYGRFPIDGRFHSEPFARVHCSTSRCPPAAAACVPCFETMLAARATFGP